MEVFGSDMATAVLLIRPGSDRLIDEELTDSSIVAFLGRQCQQRNGIDLPSNKQEQSRQDSKANSKTLIEGSIHGRRVEYPLRSLYIGSGRKQSRIFTFAAAFSAQQRRDWLTQMTWSSELPLRDMPHGSLSVLGKWVGRDIRIRI